MDDDEATTDNDSLTNDSPNGTPNDVPDDAAIIDAIGAAAAAGETATLHALLARHDGLINGIRGDGWTALHLAAYYGHLPCVQLLLERGAHTEVRSANSTRNRPLHAAIAGECSVAIITALLSAGADYNRAAGHGVTPLHLAAARGAREIAELLLSHGADPRARMDNESMPWHFADERGHPELARRLEGLAAP